MPVLKLTTPLFHTFTKRHPVPQSYKKPLIKPVLVTLPAEAIILLFLYMVVWAALYRLPHTAPGIVDMRSETGSSHYVILCCGLASNPHGFPGHCYVAWAQSLPEKLDNLETRGYVPEYSQDQIPSLFHDVPGILVDNASRGNLRNLDAVVAIVDHDVFEKTQEISLKWKHRRFRVGQSDCVAYTDEIATCLGLKTPDRLYKYPQNYIAELKRLNCHRFSDSLLN